MVGNKWRRGWDSNPSGALMLRNLLNQRNRKTETNHKNAEVRYTLGYTECSVQRGATADWFLRRGSIFLSHYMGLAQAGEGCPYCFSGGRRRDTAA
jgi:hypothetical protein